MRQWTRAMVAALLFASVGQAAAMEDGAMEGTLPRLVHLDLTVRVDYESKRVVGRASLELENPSEQPITHVPLLLNRLMRVEVVHLDSGEIPTFRQHVTAFEDLSTYQVNAVEIDLREPLPPGESIQLTVGYEGHLVGYTEIGWLYVKDHISREFTILREDALAFPSSEAHPSGSTGACRACPSGSKCR